MTMNNGEVTALVIVLLILLIMFVIFSKRCCRSIIALAKDASQAPATVSAREQLRRSVRHWSFRRAGASGRAKAVAKRQVNTVTTIDALHQERSELHPKYLQKSNSTPESGSTSNSPQVLTKSKSANSTEEAAATSVCPESLAVRYVCRENQEPQIERYVGKSSSSVGEASGGVVEPVKMTNSQIQEPTVDIDTNVSRLSNITISIANVTRGFSTDAGDSYEGQCMSKPLTLDEIHIESSGFEAGFDNPCYDKDPTDDLESGSNMDGLCVDGFGGFENLGYIAFGTPTPMRVNRMSSLTQLDQSSPLEQMKRDLTKSQSIDGYFETEKVELPTSKYDFVASRCKSLDDSHDVDATNGCLPPLKLEQIPTNATNGTAYAEQETQSNTFTDSKTQSTIQSGHAIPNNELVSAPAIPSTVRPRPKPSKSFLTKPMLPLPLPGIVSTQPCEVEKVVSNTRDRYYMPPMRNAMHPEPTVEVDPEEEPRLYVQACYNLDGVGVRFSESEQLQLNSDSFI